MRSGPRAPIISLMAFRPARRIGAMLYPVMRLLTRGLCSLPQNGGAHRAPASRARRAFSARCGGTERPEVPSSTQAPRHPNRRVGDSPTYLEAPMDTRRKPERIQTVVIGGGQAGLSVGYHLARRQLPFVVLNAHERIGDPWRQRWDSLRLFTPARFDGLDGMAFPAPPDVFPTKDEMADYLESYAKRFALPVRNGVTVDRLTRQGHRYLVSAGDQQFEAEHVVVAMANYRSRASRRSPRISPRASSSFIRASTPIPPSCATGTSCSLARATREPKSLSKWPVRVIARGCRDENRQRAVSSWRLPGPAFSDAVRAPVRLPQSVDAEDTDGRKLRPRMIRQGGPLIRVKSKDLAAVHVERLPKMVGVREGRPVLADGRVLDVANVIWCTGFHPSSSWIDLPVFAGDGEPIHERGQVTNEPGLYFVGQHFLYAMSSTMIHGVGRDAAYLADVIAARTAESRRLSEVTSTRPAIMRGAAAVGR